MIVLRLLFLMILLCTTINAYAHPLKLSLCEIEYSSEKKIISINLKLFLTDVNEAIVFDPYSKELAFCQPNESSMANQLLLNYLNQFFYIKVNSEIIELEIQNKNLKGEGDNTALWLSFEFMQTSPLKSLEIKNASLTSFLIRIILFMFMLMKNQKA